MPREDEYVQKARLNEDFARGLDKTLPTAETWSVIVVFYAALHYVQSYFAKYSTADQCHNHEAREKEIARDPKLRHILSQYKYLFKMSHTARYKCVHFVSVYPNAYPTAEKYLGVIKTQVERAKQ